MKKTTILLTLIISTLSAPEPHVTAEAAACSDSVCSLPDCKCSSTNSPEGLELAQIPQFVFFTFDDAITETNSPIYKEIFYNRVNPDGCPISATFFMSHEYTDYTAVHDLYVNHQEIALHSVSHLALTDYWRNISIEDVTHEFGDEKTIIAKFANIPEDAIKGMRLPFLQLSGDNSFQAGKDIGLLYDCSWPTQTFRKPGLWPYTLDYKSIQDCSIGPCPTSSIPGMWVVPMIEWTDQENVICSMVDACVNIPDDNADDLMNWFRENFEVQYKGNRAPFGFYVHAAYFAVNEIHLDAYKKFIDYLLTLPDVYLVSPSQAISWIQNPVPIGSGSWPDLCPNIEDRGCEPLTCPLHLEGEENDVYMTFCGSECPDVYPWLNNPLGEAKN